VSQMPNPSSHNVSLSAMPNSMASRSHTKIGLANRSKDLDSDEHNNNNTNLSDKAIEKVKLLQSSYTPNPMLNVNRDILEIRKLQASSANKIIRKPGTS
jgi:hypothetical protein